MPDFRTNPLQSRKYYEYVRHVYVSETSCYSSNIAEELGVNRPRATQVLGNLEYMGVLKSHKEGRRKIYRVNFEGLYRVHMKIIAQEMTIKNLGKNSIEILDRYDGNIYTSLEDDENQLIKSDKRLDLSSSFFKKYFERHKDSTISEMSFSNFFIGYGGAMYGESGEFGIYDEVYDIICEDLPDPVITFEKALNGCD